MIGALFQSLAAGLSLWQSSEKRKYLDKLISLKRDYYEEFNKGPSVRSDAILDNIQFELQLISLAFSSAVTGEQNLTNKSK